MDSRLFLQVGGAAGGRPRTLAAGIATAAFPGDRAVVVRCAPNARGVARPRPEEPWGACVSVCGVGDHGDRQSAAGSGDVLRISGGAPCAMAAGSGRPAEMGVLSPPRTACAAPGAGFAAGGDA